MALGLKYKNQEHIFEEKTVDGVPYLAYPLLEKTGAVRHGFSTRLGGVSTTIRRRWRRTGAGSRRRSESGQRI